MVLTDYPGHLVALALAAGLAVLTVVAFHAPEVRTPARRGYGRLLMLLQYAVILVLLVILWDPSALRTSRTSTTNTVVALFDTSESMSIADDRQRTRLDRALEKFTTSFRPDDATGPHYRLYGFDRHAYHCGTPDLLRRWGTETNLHAAISLLTDQLRPAGPDAPEEVSSVKGKVLRDSSELPASDLRLNTSGLKLQTSSNAPVGAILFTDGHATDRNIDSYSLPARKDVPVLLVGVGSAQSHPDLALKAISAPAQAWIETTYPVTVALSRTHAAQEPLTVELLRDQAVIDSRRIGPEQWKKQASRFEAAVEFKVPADSLGTHVLTARAPPQKDEVNTANNLRSTSVGVAQEQTLQVLLYTQKASFDVGKLRQALAWNRRVRCDFRLDAFRTVTPPPRAVSEFGGGEFPQTREELNRYDVVILGACDAIELTTAQWDALHQFVAERGGGLLLLPGKAPPPAYRWVESPVGELAPVRLDPNKVRFWPPEPNTIERTFEAQALGLLSRTFSAMPEQKVTPYYSVAQTKPAATTLATVSATPILSVHRIGRGRVGLLNISKLFKLYREDKEGGLLADCIGELAAYLGRTPATAGGIELFAERAADDPRRVRFSACVLNEDSQPVDEANVLLSVGGQVVTMPPAGDGRYTVEVDLGTAESIVATAQAEARGKFLGERILTAHLPSLPDEMSDTDFDEAFLRALAQRLGARYVPMEDLAGDAAKAFVAQRQTGTAQQVRSLWPNWPLLVVLFLLLSAKWFIRRSLGLV